MVIKRKITLHIYDILFKELYKLEKFYITSIIYINKFNQSSFINKLSWKSIVRLLLKFINN
jgi:hypothetical protein